MNHTPPSKNSTTVIPSKTFNTKTHVVYGGYGPVAFGEAVNLDHGNTPIVLGETV
jgi:hypothetical protein